MARFLFCLPRFHTNAAPWMRILQEAGHETFVDVVERGPTENYQYAVPVLHPAGPLSRCLGQLIRDQGANGQYVFPALRAYWKHLSALDPDVVIVRGVTRWFCRLGALYAVLQRRRLVIYDQEDVTPRRWSSTWIRRAVFRMFGVPHVTARAIVDADPRMLGSAIPLPFGCPFEPSGAASLWTRPLHWPPRLLMVAKYRDRKGHAVLLQALAKLRHVPFRLTFCGEEATPRDTDFRKGLVATAERLGIEDRLSFRSNVAPEEMREVYSSHDVFILPSRLEPAAVSPIEAAWAGCAVLLSRDSGTRGYFPRGVAYDFRADDADDVARAVAGILASPTSLQQARDECVAYIHAIGGDAHILARLESLLPERQRSTRRHSGLCEPSCHK